MIAITQPVKIRKHQFTYSLHIERWTVKPNWLPVSSAYLQKLNLLEERVNKKKLRLKSCVFLEARRKKFSSFVFWWCVIEFKGSYLFWFFYFYQLIAHCFCCFSNNSSFLPLLWQDCTGSKSTWANTWWSISPMSTQLPNLSQCSAKVLATALHRCTH